ncbi:MAG: hypothetical protein ACK51N_06065 [bacterium]
MQVGGGGGGGDCSHGFAGDGAAGCDTGKGIHACQSIVVARF